MRIEFIKTRLSSIVGLSLVCQFVMAGVPGAGQSLRDPLIGGGAAPEVVVIPGGEFIMGSNETEVGRYTDEGPQHLVTFDKPFAIGKTEVTVGEFRRFVEATGYRTSAEHGRIIGSLSRNTADGEWNIDPTLNWRHGPQGGISSDDMPVIHVSWRDALAYTQWLAQQTGQPYRLPSEAELEYVNRAGNDSVYSWGNSTPHQRVANLRGEHDVALMSAKFRISTKDELTYLYAGGQSPLTFNDYGDGFGELSPVASFAPNAFGLHDTTGNVWEWSQDCWHESYSGAPSDGSAWVDGGDCSVRMMRGGSWYCFPRHLRSANRWGENLYFRNMYVGFRVAKDM